MPGFELSRLARLGGHQGSPVCLLAGNTPDYTNTPLGQNLWRAGRAHAGVYFVLSLAMPRYVDEVALSPFWKWLSRIEGPMAADLIPGALFLAAAALSCGTGLIRAVRRLEQ
jgi:hypothetical protein